MYTLEKRVRWRARSWSFFRSVGLPVEEAAAGTELPCEVLSQPLWFRCQAETDLRRVVMADLVVVSRCRVRVVMHSGDLEVF